MRTTIANRIYAAAASASTPTAARDCCEASEPSELLTPRLRLTPHRMEDFEDSLAMWTSPEVARFIGGKSSTPEEVWARLLRYAGLWALLGFGYWTVRERDSGAFVGETGFADFHRDIEPPIGAGLEIGWALRPDMHGRGYAREAVGAALAWADGTLRVAETVCMIAPENERSIRLAEGLGFQASADATYRGAPMRLFRRTRGAALSLPVPSPEPLRLAGPG